MPGSGITVRDVRDALDAIEQWVKDSRDKLKNLKPDDQLPDGLIQKQGPGILGADCLRAESVRLRSAKK